MIYQGDGCRLKVGIPRGLLFYRFYAYWTTFLKELGADLVISPPTNKLIIQRGLTYGVDEICFPVKVFLGHCHYLKDKVDSLFVPRMVSFCKNEYNCPKILGLPDVVRNLFNIPQERIIDDEINMRDRGFIGWRQGFIEIGKRFTSNVRKINHALQIAEEAHFQYRKKIANGYFPENLIDNHPMLTSYQEKILLLGHSYLINDSYINMNILHKMNTMGYSIVTSDMIDNKEIRKALKKIPKPSFWTISNEVLGSALYSIYQKDPAIKGFVHLVSFECGPDSLVGELIERWLKREVYSIPYLRLEIDEHTGEAGLITRLEAFVDMMKWRAETFESNLSSSCSSECGSGGSLSSTGN